MIDTRLVYGFLDAGKTHYIQDCIMHDYFHKYGTTLIICFEQGEEEYDAGQLLEKRTYVAYYDGGQEVGLFCRRAIERHRPDRIYVEMNAMMQFLREQLPDEMNISFVTTWIDWTTFGVYFNNFRQIFSRMASESHQVTFRGCPSKELLSPYSQAFRLMNRKAAYLRQDPMGYHEKAFDIFVPFSLEEDSIEIGRSAYLPLWLDAADHPEHYDGKTLIFKDPLELRRNGPEEPWIAGRVVMTCCMADLQFMGFELSRESEVTAEGGWMFLEADAKAGKDDYGRNVLKLRPVRAIHARPPEDLILTALRA